ncbi:MAG: vanadium-dependent haloperoxidase [Limisphaerales bacterium]
MRVTEPRIQRSRCSRFAGLLLLAGFLGAAGLRANVVLEWNALMLDAIRVDNSGPTLSTRNLAILHTAIFDGVNAIAGSHQPYLGSIAAAPDASREAAVCAAGREVMLTLYPPFQARTGSLYELQRAALPDTPATLAGLEIGLAAARAMLGARSNDGSNTQVPYIPSDAPAQWRRTPPFFRPPLDPHWRHVRLFALPEKESFLPPPPPALTSEPYARDVEEVKILGAADSSTRTTEQSQIAVFWSDFSYTAMPPGHWHEIAATIVHNQHTSFEDTARLMALLSLAQADAAIVCWEAKYRFNFWRPVTAIRRADEDGNPATEADPVWDHYLNAPNFPEYPSGHSTFSKASARVLTRFYGTDTLEFTVASDSLPGILRSFASLAACADEVGMSRIFGGIHFMSANREGKRSGGRIGDYVSDHFLLANDDLPVVRLVARTDGIPELRIHGRSGTACLLEGSNDLVAWSPVATVNAVAGGVLVKDPVAAGAANRYYRVAQTTTPLQAQSPRRGPTAQTPGFHP